MIGEEKEGVCMKNFQLTTYSLRSPKIKPQREPLRFLFISDLYNVTFGRKNEVLIRKMKELRPHAVLVGGDLIVAKPGYSMDPAMELIREMGARFPVYYALGNHEYRMRIYPETYGDMYDRYKRVIEESGVVLLDQKKKEIRAEGNKICICGFELDRTYYKKGRRKQLPAEELSAAFGEPQRDVFTILLAHNPLYGDTYLDWGADLTLSGHLHGGMIRLGKRAVVSPDFTLFPKYGYGMYRRGDSSLIVSAGMGEHTIPVRICNPRELVVVELWGE